MKCNVLKSKGSEFQFQEIEIEIGREGKRRGEGEEKAEEGEFQFQFETGERYLCNPRLLSTFDPERDTFRYVRDNLTDIQLDAADEPGALMIVKTIRLSVGPKTTQEAVRLLLDFFRLDFLRRHHGETMRHWTRQFALRYSKVGKALNASNSEISKDFLHENI